MNRIKENGWDKVLIESDWNLKEDLCRIETHWVYRINRIRLEFKVC